MSFVSAAVLSLALTLIPGQADDAYQFIVGLCDKQMHELAVQEAEAPTTTTGPGSRSAAGK